MDLSAIKAEYETTAKKCLLERDTVCERLTQDDFSPRPPRILFCPPIRTQIRRLPLIAADDDLDA